MQERDGIDARLEEMIPDRAERGAGVILRHGGEYLFFLAGRRYHSRGATFFAGIGGHVEAGETWVESLQREAREEVGAAIELIDSPHFYLISGSDQVSRVEVDLEAGRPRPVALLEIPIPADVSWNKRGEDYPYYILIYRGRLDAPALPQPGDVDGLLLLPPHLVLRSLQERMTLGDLLSGGARLIEKQPTPRELRVYPFGSARAMALLMRAGESF